MYQNEMADCTGPQLSVDWFGMDKTTLIMSDWTNGQDSHNIDRSCTLSSNLTESDYQKRSNIVHAIIHNNSLEHLGNILRSGWDVNETLTIPDHQLNHTGCLVHHYTKRTALGEAVKDGWTEGVRMLLEAGAICEMTGSSSNILTFALTENVALSKMNPDCPTDLINLLLEYGADPNAHDGQSQNIPLFLVIDRTKSVDTIKLLLEHGADPNVIGWSESRNEYNCPLSRALRRTYGVLTSIIQILILSGANVNYDIPTTMPLLHGMIYRCFCNTIPRENLDIFFQLGGNVNIKDGNHNTALEFAIKENVHCNKIKWLIRHGADISFTKFSHFKDGISPFTRSQCVNIQVLLHAGGRISQGVLMLLNEMERVISTWTDDSGDLDAKMLRMIRNNWDGYVEAEEKEGEQMQGSVRKFTFPDHLAHQMNDLEEFSDESLHIYPEEDGEHHEWWQQVLLQTHRIQELLCQPKSLQWYCRCSVRDNLVSLQPSAVKTLPVAPILKRYILCHEI